MSGLREAVRNLHPKPSTFCLQYSTVTYSLNLSYMSDDWPSSFPYPPFFSLLTHHALRHNPKLNTSATIVRALIGSNGDGCLTRMVHPPWLHCTKKYHTQAHIIIVTHGLHPYHTWHPQFVLSSQPATICADTRLTAVLLWSTSLTTPDKMNFCSGNRNYNYRKR